MVLLEDVLQKNRSWVLSHPEHTLQEPSLQKVNQMIERRVKREPLAYIRGKAWFYGRFFEVNPRVLIPRPESESFINLLKQIKPRPKIITDIGTGSGALAITAKLEFPKTQVIATDIDSKALQVAKKNARKHKANIKFINSSLLNWYHFLHDREKSDTILLANLPYVPKDLITSPEITYEPKTALFSGKDGLDHYQKFWGQIANMSQKPRWIMVESLTSQHQKQKSFAKKAGYKLIKSEILVQLFKKNLIFKSA